MTAAETYTVGRIRVHLVSDGLYRTDGGGLFGVVPRVLWEPVVRPDEFNRVSMALRCLLIESSDGLILVDTGYGDKLPAKRRQQLSLEGEKRLIGSLAPLGCQPGDVRVVINTHLHGDHCGGNTVHGEEGRVVPAFPNARYLVQRLELADATYPNERTRNAYFHENFLPLGEPWSDDRSGLLEILNGNTQVAPEVRTVITPGHTRAHQAVFIESDGETAIFLADAAPWAVQLERLPWVPAFDLDPLMSMEAKRSLRDWALRHNALLFFQHDSTISAGRLRRDGERWRVEPEEAA